MSDLRLQSSSSRTSQRVRLPLLDRLLDADPSSTRDPVTTPAIALETLRAAVRRDLEALLNARRRRWPLPEKETELAASPLGYGIPDATSGASAQAHRRAELAADVERVIRRFEPRLLSACTPDSHLSYSDCRPAVRPV
jgi:type VI secretion system protein ImpF